MCGCDKNEDGALKSLAGIVRWEQFAAGWRWDICRFQDI